MQWMRKVQAHIVFPGPGTCASRLHAYRRKPSSSPTTLCKTNGWQERWQRNLLQWWRMDCSPGLHICPEIWNWKHTAATPIINWNSFTVSLCLSTHLNDWLIDCIYKWTNQKRQHKKNQKTEDHYLTLCSYAFINSLCNRYIYIIIYIYMIICKYIFI